MVDPSASSSRSYVLSSVLEGHTDDVRSLSSNSQSLFSASRDSTAREWGFDGDQWKTRRTFAAHEGFVNACCWIPDHEESCSKSGYLITGGQDAIIQVFDLDDAADGASPRHTLLGHTGNVCALHSAGDTIVSGSWDYTARVWSTRDWNCVRILSDHRAAVWDVLALSLKGYEGDAVTACADGLIRLFKASDEASPIIFKGHTGPVRALTKLLPEDPDCNLFASASNDGSIRIWNVAGDAITTLAGHDSFIYALVSIPSTQGGGLASSGEDGIVRIWEEEEGDLEQEIEVPALSVWSLTTLPNGDLAIACSDNMIWVFTRDERRRADATIVRKYEAGLIIKPRYFNFTFCFSLGRDKTILPKPHKANCQPSSLPTSSPASLTIHGSREGEVKLVEADGKTNAYTWKEDKWELIGEVTSKPSNGNRPAHKMQHEGDEYDLVIDVDVKDDEPPLKLALNLDDDPSQIAEAFVEKHGLPKSYIERIVEYIGQFT